ncbi:hypothetical protein CP985_13525 [Malaciobacter mytili LMG 24559]|uniref:Uncharacterized protein n=1 Tax=Malaciobacter mytili LMG 24559 TaxID=1032238 RepID=A0AAX2AG06_9BACT|nr:hypothetical protein [Malaciobacter mytili]AXH16469.1 hypothetical protein AMYT_a0171 [Malaciobacter mytili LMG 24559]RXK12970.1 hypothetical protein CP985_13525 [Malaciobacter mytili LMG 24559]
MEIKIKINDKDFIRFTQKVAELGLDPLDTIELIITKSLNERNLESSIIKEKKSKNDTEELFIDFENKMKKYHIHQSSIAHYLQTTQASISRALKSKKDNTLFFKQMSILHDKLLVEAYIYQNRADIDFNEIKLKKPLPGQCKPFLIALKGRLNSNPIFENFSSKNLEIICNFIQTEYFQKLDFESIYLNIDDFIIAINISEETIIKHLQL